MSKKLKEAYCLLPENEKMVLQFLSIAYEPVTIKNFHDVLREWKETGRSDNVPSQRESKDIFVKLENLKLVYNELGYRCSKELIGDITLDAYQSGNSGFMLNIVRVCFPLGKNGSFWRYSPADRYLREIRIAAYEKDVNGYMDNLEIAYAHEPQMKDWNIFDIIFNSPFNAEWFATLPVEFQYSSFMSLCLKANLYLDSTDKFLSFIADRQAETRGIDSSSYSVFLSETYILQGKFKEASSVEWGYENLALSMAHKASIDFLNGKNEDAIEEFENALVISKKKTKKKNVYFEGIIGMFHLLALIKSGDFVQSGKIVDIINGDMKKNRVCAHYSSYHIDAIVHANAGHLSEAEKLIETYSLYDDNYLDMLSYSIVTLWFFPAYLRQIDGKLKVMFNRAKRNKFDWVAMEFAFILGRLFPTDNMYLEFATKTQNRLGVQSILSLIKNEESWERSLKALKSLNTGNTQQNLTKASSSRLVWLMNPLMSDIMPKEQSLSSNGTWSKGRPVALKRIMNCELDCMTTQDKAIAKTIEKSEYTTYRYYSETVYNFDIDKALIAIAGHPFIFLSDSPETSVELVKAEPELIVKKSDNGFEIKFSENICGVGTVMVRETPTRFKVIEVTETQARISEIIGSNGLLIPKMAEKEAMSVIENLSSIVTIHSDIDQQAVDIPTVEANPQLYAHLMPVAEGFRIEVFVKPFGHDGPSLIPGSGGINVFAEIKGKRVQTKRDLEQEKENADDVISACPLLTGMGVSIEGLTFKEPDDCLQVLLELKELGSKIVMEWPEGGQFKVTSTVSFDNLKLAINKKTDWFEVTGELNIDENLTMDIQKIIELVGKSSGNFVAIEDGLFMSMTKEFRKRVAELSAFSEKGEKGLKFHPLASLAMKDFVDNVKDFKAGKDWKNHVLLLKDAQAFQPQLPSTLQTELRDYQLEGFNWLARLAKWGVGACLADDMGLGKTIQAIAILLDRATKGPCLVVAPASVCPNWFDETNRFGPTLNPELFGGKNREKKLNELKPFDMLICSYGMMQSEEEKLSKVKWATIVLDEAQAIKNFSAKRSKSAMALQGEFKLITTGTPIENHLGELWNLFRFINPGLLGTLERFNTKFANPIEKDNDIEVKNRLKRLIQPFILRRLKNQVLDELPPKTEITLSVELNVEEASFYEALRQQALENLESVKEEGGGSIHLKVLVELMKLRRACCHPSLVMPDIDIKSSKLTLFTEIVEELLENRHKVLVFSQFVGHLSIIKAQVEKMGIAYQYLDGSTPIKDRKRRVDAFQAGEGDMFLISLKAGGLGLNLTAADYVIHMDPWWNPAVEDQASDRAHRIGQKHPVTIYRFVTKNTIEEKIVNLHARKRSLADSLLEGTESAGKITAEQLIGLIKDV